MLKRSKRNINLNMNEKTLQNITAVLTIIDNSFQKHYKKMFYYVYIDQTKYTLNQIVNKCYRSFHTLILDIDMLNKIIENTLKEFKDYN